MVKLIELVKPYWKNITYNFKEIIMNKFSEEKEFLLFENVGCKIIELC